MTRDEHLQQAMAHELEIVWLEELDDIDYVRQGAYLLWSRTRAPANSPTVHVVGYATVGKAARGVAGYFLRRAFWLKPYDRPLFSRWPLPNRHPGRRGRSPHDRARGGRGSDGSGRLRATSVEVSLHTMGQSIGCRGRGAVQMDVHATLLVRLAVDILILDPQVFLS